MKITFEDYLDKMFESMTDGWELNLGGDEKARVIKDWEKDPGTIRGWACYNLGVNPIDVVFAYGIWDCARFYYGSLNAMKYAEIGIKMGCDPLVVSFLFNVDAIFARRDASVKPDLTERLADYADVVSTKGTDLWKYCDEVYKVKPEFEKLFSFKWGLDSDEQGREMQV